MVEILFGTIFLYYSIRVSIYFMFFFFKKGRNLSEESVDEDSLSTDFQLFFRLSKQ